MKFLKILALPFLFLLVLTAKPAAAQQSNIEKYVLALHEKKFEWMCHKQLDSLAAILDDRLVYIHSNAWTQSKTDMINDLQSGKLVMNKVTVNEASADYFKDNIVIVHGKGVFNVDADGKTIDVNLYYTEVYIKKKNNWLLVSRHASKLP